MAETTVAVSFSECGGGMVVDKVDADLLAALHRAIPATSGHTLQLVTLGRPLQGLEVRVVDQDGRHQLALAPPLPLPPLLPLVLALLAVSATFWLSELSEDLTCLPGLLSDPLSWLPAFLSDPRS